jgi:ribosomal protein S6
MKKYENEGLVNQAIVDQLTIQDSAIQRLSKNIEQYDGLHKSLSEQLDDKQRINDDILKTLELQESFHKTILERLDHQEVLNQKLSRDLDHLKATLFERIGYVVEKIEENYKQITEYVTQLFTKSGFIRSLTIEKKKKEKETTLSK